jgi:hypothetical protein
MTKTTNHTSTLTTQNVANSAFMKYKRQEVGVSDSFGNGFNITSTALGLIRVMTNAAKKTNASAKSQ